jgi:glycosyltransferase involved in cell wall biosynthesis
MKLSIVSPVYRGEKMLEELVKRIHAAVSPLTNDYEIVLVNDCSPDNSWEKIAKIYHSYGAFSKEKEAYRELLKVLSSTEQKIVYWKI